MSKAREEADDFVNKYVDSKSGEVDAHKAVNLIEELLAELDQYQKVVDAAKEYMSVHDESSNKQLEENLLVALVELNE